VNPLVRSHRDPLYGFTTQELEQWLAKKLEGRVTAAYLFGSLGTGRFGAWSDIDLMVVAAADLPFVERASAFDDLRDRVPSLQILVYTPEEFRRLTERPTVGFWQSVVSTLRRIV
jgi:predicted nucleotidyltransferase